MILLACTPKTAQTVQKRILNPSLCFERTCRYIARGVAVHISGWKTKRTSAETSGGQNECHV